MGVTTELPIDRLRAGAMTDDEVVRVAAETVRNNVDPRHPYSRVFAELAERLLLMRLAAPLQTRAHSTVTRNL